MINPIKYFFGIEGNAALNRYQGPGYNTLLLWFIPGDLLSACSYRQFHTLIDLLDSRAALKNSYLTHCRPCREAVCTIFLVFGAGTCDLSHERRTHLPLSQPDTVWVKSHQFIYQEYKQYMYIVNVSKMCIF